MQQKSLVPRHVLHNRRKTSARALPKIFVCRRHKQELPQVFWQHLPHELIPACLLGNNLPLASARAVCQLHSNHASLHKLEYVARARNQLGLLDTLELFQTQAV